PRTRGTTDRPRRRSGPSRGRRFAGPGRTLPPRRLYHPRPGGLPAEPGASGDRSRLGTLRLPARSGGAGGPGREGTVSFVKRAWIGSGSTNAPIVARWVGRGSATDETDRG